MLPVGIHFPPGRWLVLACLAVATMAHGQDKFTVNGRLKVEGGGLDGCRMVVYRNGEKSRTVSTDLNRFSLELELGQSYILSFEKQGFVTKKLSFNTKVSARAAQLGFTPFEFVVSLFKQYDGMNTVVFNQPVGMIRYDNVLGDFDYDTDYTKSIQSALEEAQAEVAKKQKEEAGREAEAAKRKEREAREKAKSEAKAAKAKEQAQAQAPPEKPPVVAELPPPVPEKVKEAPKPPAPRTPAEAGTVAKPAERTEARRVAAPHIYQEASSVQPAMARTVTEPRPKFEATPLAAVRHQEVFARPNEVVTVIKLEKGGEVNEYRRVSRKYSGVYYFKNGASCTQLTYEREALAEN